MPLYDVTSNREWTAAIRGFPLKDLPNQQGFEFVGIRADGSRVMCEVSLGDDGMHRVVGERFENLVGWRYPATAEHVLRGNGPHQ